MVRKCIFAIVTTVQVQVDTWRYSSISSYNKTLFLSKRTKHMPAYVSLPYTKFMVLKSNTLNFHSLGVVRVHNCHQHYSFQS